MMNSFRVWIRPLGETCRIRVEGIRNAQWLLSRLGHGFVFKTAEPISEEADSSYCSFRLAYSARMPRGGLERLLAGIPEVVLMVDPA